MLRWTQAKSKLHPDYMYMQGRGFPRLSEARHTELEHVLHGTQQHERRGEAHLRRHVGDVRRRARTHVHADRGHRRLRQE